MSTEPIPPRIAKLARDHRGFPVPWFVQWLDEQDRPLPYGQGHPDFRIIDATKFVRAVKERLCWVCGEPLGAHLAFLIGPMCAINRVTSEPPAHRECALYSARVCPFLSRPRMRRNEKGLPDHPEIAGFHLDHNPGAMALWMARDYKPFRAHAGGDGVLIRIGEPTAVLWIAEGKPASRQQVDAAIAKGLPRLRAMAEEDGAGAVRELEKMIAAVQPLLPPAITEGPPARVLP